MKGAAWLAERLGLPIPTEEQQAIIEGPLAPALVVAGAGSGKTETMAARVVYLVANGVVRPDQILGLTFTRKAAAQLGQRVRTRLRAVATLSDLGAPPDHGESDIGTYHAFGGRLIDDFGALAGIEPGATVLTPTASWQLARRVVGRWDGDLDTDLGPDAVTERLLAISGTLADHLIDETMLGEYLNDLLETLRSAPPSPRQRGPLHSGLAQHVKRLQDRRWILPLVGAYTAAKRERGVVDFADQMQLAATLVQGHPRVAAALRERYAVVLLDEYQDTGHAQRVILRTLFGDGADAVAAPRVPVRASHPVIAVGDPVQSIYSWRGASASNLPRFTTDFPAAGGHPAPALPLLTSFRNARRVLDVANEASMPVRTAAGAVAVGELRARAAAPDGEIAVGLFETVSDEDSWLAERIGGRWRAAAAAGEPSPTSAVLVRRRSDMSGVAAALRAQGLPVEVVGLGGLLDEPEIADLVSVLRVLVDPWSGPAVLRLLTGPRWMLGMADVEGLARRSRELAASATRRRPPTVGAQELESARADLAVAIAGALGGEDIDAASLIDAIEDPGPPARYSSRGYRRITRFSAELTRLRARLHQPLPDLVAELESATGLDVEVQLHSSAGRAHLDAFAQVVHDVAATGAGPRELLDYLDAAAEREDGLAPGEVPEVSGRVQVLTVHAAKGLEWEIVAVPHLSEGVFPITRGSTWLGDPAQLPPSLRGDGAELPSLALPAGGDQKAMADALAAHADAFREQRLDEERRLLYVALTRAESTLLASGHWWSATVATPVGPSEFLTEIARTAGAAPDEWAPRPADDAVNPLTARPRTASWPVDPLGERRAAVRSAADLVLTKLAGPPVEDGEGGVARVAGDGGVPPVGAVRSTGVGGWSRPRGESARDGDPPDRWAADVEVLLAERGRRASRELDVPLPGTVSVSTLVELAADPQRLARRLRRPVPVEPTPDRRRGTAFHRWLERYYGGDALLDVDELPGAGDSYRPRDDDLDRLRDAFLTSVWASRVPQDVELSFATTIAGLGLRGRIDAIFRDPDGGVTVVDWKTGSPPGPSRLAHVGVQLACYRVAVADLRGLPLDKVRACFYYVGHDVTLSPADLLDADGIAELIAGSTEPLPGEVAS